ncbi:MAG: hypothetical protein JJ992_26990, partial [Planctomycetes bacterium]|nr:hypothetical protein [Planctomycetota bacterium]
MFVTSTFRVIESSRIGKSAYLQQKSGKPSVECHHRELSLFGYQTDLQSFVHQIPDLIAEPLTFLPANVFKEYRQVLSS